MKRKKPEFIYPFKDKEHEESCKFLDIRRMNMVSDRNSKVELTETIYTGGYRKIELKETIYIKKGNGQKLGELLYLRPYDQIRMKKLIDFVVHINKDGEMFLTRKDYAKEPLDFTPDQRAIIRLFYERKNVTLEDAVEILGTYKNTESLRVTIRKINRRVVGHFKLTDRDEFIKGDFDRKRKGYAFNPDIRLEFIDDRVLGE